MWYTLKHLIALANPTLAHTLDSTFPSSIGGSERVGYVVPTNSRSSQDPVVMEKEGKVMENHALFSQSSTVVWWLKSKGGCCVGCIRTSEHQEGPSSSVNVAFINLISSVYILNLNMRTEKKILACQIPVDFSIVIISFWHSNQQCTLLITFLLCLSYTRMLFSEQGWSLVNVPSLSESSSQLPVSQCQGPSMCEVSPSVRDLRAENSAWHLQQWS